MNSKGHAAKNLFRDLAFLDKDENLIHGCLNLNWRIPLLRKLVNHPTIQAFIKSYSQTKCSIGLIQAN